MLEGTLAEDEVSQRGRDNVTSGSGEDGCILV